MKRKFKTLILFFFILLPALTYAQNDLRWRLIPQTSPFAQISRLEDIHFINANSGWTISNFQIGSQLYLNVYKTTDGGRTWSTISDTSFSSLRSIGFADSLNGWLGTLAWPGTVLYRTTDGGFNWIETIQSAVTDSLGICGISVVDNGHVFGCGRYFDPARFFKTSNGGINWTVKNLNAHITTLIDCHFFNKDSGFVVGGTGNTFSNRNGAVLFTSDGGETWINRFTTAPRGQWCWKISFPDRQNGYISLEKLSSGMGSSVYFLKTTDGGDTWKEKVFLNSFADEEGIGFINANTGWIGGWNFSTYKTTDGGDTWNSDPWGYNVNRIRVISDTLAYAAGRGVYKFSRDSIVNVSTLSTNVPASFNIYQNFPNPFNPVTGIKFDIAKRGNVRLIVFDMLGRELSTLMNESLDPGTYQVSFDGSGLSSGIYFCRLQSENITNTMKMNLIK